MSTHNICFHRQIRKTDLREIDYSYTWICFSRQSLDCSYSWTYYFRKKKKKKKKKKKTMWGKNMRKSAPENVPLDMKREGLDQAGY